MDFRKSNPLVHFLQKGIFAPDHTYQSGYNFCQHGRNIAGGILLTFIMFYAAGWLIVFGIPPWLLYFFVSGFPMPFSTEVELVGVNIHVASILLAVCLILIAVLFVMAWCDAKIKDWAHSRGRRRDERVVKSGPTWYQEAYTAFKEKYCPLVHIIDDDPKED